MRCIALEGSASAATSRARYLVCRGMHLGTVVALALCTTASSFVVQSTGRYAQSAPAGRHDGLSQHASHSARAGVAGNPADATRDRLRRQRTLYMGVVTPREAGNEGGVPISGRDGASSLRDGANQQRASSSGRVDLGGGEGGEVGGVVGVAPVLSSTPTAPARTEIPTDVAVVGAPQQVVEKEYSIEAILKELAEIQNQGPKNYCVLGTRHCSFLHQQIIELLAYALVLSGNHVFTSGAMGTNAATIRGALRAERKELLTVVLPQSLEKQSEASRDLIHKVTNVVTNPQNDHLPLDAASRLCNSDLLSRTEQLICFAFHDSKTIIECSKEARSLNMIVTELYLD